LCSRPPCLSITAERSGDASERSSSRTTAPMAPCRFSSESSSLRSANNSKCTKEWESASTLTISGLNNAEDALGGRRFRRCRFLRTIRSTSSNSRSRSAARKISSTCSVLRPVSFALCQLSQLHSAARTGIKNEARLSPKRTGGRGQPNGGGMPNGASRQTISAKDTRSAKLIRHGGAKSSSERRCTGRAKARTAIRIPKKVRSASSDTAHLPKVILAG
jgi:hypothetical protein